MLRYKTTRPGLVILYDIRPGNGASQFLKPNPGAWMGLGVQAQMPKAWVLRHRVGGGVTGNPSSDPWEGGWLPRPDSSWFDSIGLSSVQYLLARSDSEEKATTA